MKKTITIATLLSVLTLLLPHAARSSDFPAMKLTFSMTEAENSIVGRGVQAMKKYIEEKTGGKVTLDAYYSSSLVAQDMEIESIMKGTLDMNSCWFDWLSPYMDELNVLNVPYLFKDWNHMERYFESADAKSLVDRMAGELGIRVFLPVYYKGARAINLTEDIKVTKRADLGGVKIRMPNSEAWQFMGEALGANPVPLGINELYMALQTGSVNGQDNGFSTTKAFSFQEVTKSVTVTGHMIGAGFIAIGEKQWQAMTPELRRVVAEGVAHACDVITRTAHDEEMNDAKMFEQAGLKVYWLNSDELSSYRTEVLDYYLGNPKMTANLDKTLYERISAMAE